MIDHSHAKDHLHTVTNFNDLVSSPFFGEMNAICWNRELKGDFLEIINKVALKGNITVLDEEQLNALQLSEQGQLARELLLNDLTFLKVHGAAPTLNVIQHYERDDS